MKQLILIIAFLINIQAFAQENKTVNLVVSGQGSTKDAAKQNALRSAIEQAFGTFISSKTEILKDELVSDEIVSVANGNIQEFEIISEVQIPNGNHAITLNATVSVSKLVSFVERKGVELEFKGGLLAANVKQQILNEQNEIKSIENISRTCKEILDSSCDYEISNGEPKQQNNDNNTWSIPLTINVKFNENIEQFNSYLLSSIRALSMNEIEIEEYKNLGKQTYKIAIANYGLAGRTNNIEELKSIDKLNTNLTFELNGYLKYTMPREKYSFSTEDFNEIVKEYKRKEKNLIDEKAYENIEIKYYDNKINPVYHFRSFASVISIIDLLNYTKHSVLNFEITNGINIVTGADLVSDNNKKRAKYVGTGLANGVYEDLKNNEYSNNGHELKILTNNITPFLRDSETTSFGVLGIFEENNINKKNNIQNLIFESYEPFSGENIEQFKFAYFFEPDEITKLKFGSLIHLEKDLLREKSIAEFRNQGYVEYYTQLYDYYERDNNGSSNSGSNSDFQAIATLYDFRKDDAPKITFSFTDFLKLNELEKIESYKITPIIKE